MADMLLGVAFFCLLATLAGSGAVFVIWTIVSSLTARVSKPRKEGFRYALLWAICAWTVVTVPLIFLSTQAGFSIATVMLMSAALAALCSIAGACYGNGKESD